VRPLRLETTFDSLHNHVGGENLDVVEGIFPPCFEFEFVGSSFCCLQDSV